MESRPPEEERPLSLRDLFPALIFSFGRRSRRGNLPFGKECLVDTEGVAEIGVVKEDGEEEPAD